MVIKTWDKLVLDFANLENIVWLYFYNNLPTTDCGGYHDFIDSQEMIRIIKGFLNFYDELECESLIEPMPTDLRNSIEKQIDYLDELGYIYLSNSKH